MPAAAIATPLMTLGVLHPLHVRVEIDEADIPRFHAGADAYASLRGEPEVRVPLTYVRTEPYVIPKKSLTGGVTQRIDTRVLQIIYAVDPRALAAIAGQQVDVYIDEGSKPRRTPRLRTVAVPSFQRRLMAGALSMAATTS